MNNSNVLAKLIVVLIFCFYGHEAICQRTKSPLYFLDSVEIDIHKVYIHPTSIKSIKVDRKKGNGEIYIYSKKDSLSLTNLWDIVEEKTEIEKLASSMVFKINGDIINDTSDIKIDSRFFIYVTVNSLEKVDYIKNNFKPLKIINIDLERKEREEKIYIRGELDSLTKLQK